MRKYRLYYSFWEERSVAKEGFLLRNGTKDFYHKHLWGPRTFRLWLLAFVASTNRGIVLDDITSIQGVRAWYQGYLVKISSKSVDNFVRYWRLNEIYPTLQTGSVSYHALRTDTSVHRALMVSYRKASTILCRQVVLATMICGLTTQSTEPWRSYRTKMEQREDTPMLTGCGITID